MATESIGKIVVMDNDFADQFIAMGEELKKNPPQPNTREIPWGDAGQFMEALRREYGDAK
jgi:hypothetical protein